MSDIVIDLSHVKTPPTDNTITINGRPVYLTPMEARLFMCLYNRPGTWHQWQGLVRVVWTDPGRQPRNPYSSFTNLMTKLQGKLTPGIIKSGRWGQGYCWPGQRRGRRVTI